MTVTTKTITNISTTIIQQSEKKYNFISSLLANNNSSTSVPSIASRMDTSTTTTVAAIKKKTTNNTTSKYKLFKPWSHSQNSEYKSLEKALARFQSKDRHKVEILKTIVIPWWNLLITFLPEAAYTDRTLYFECILINEFEDLDQIGPIPQLDVNDTYMDIPLDIILTYRTALMSTLYYAIDRLNQKGVYSNVISFCARVLAICFFKIPGVGFALLQALPVNKSHIKRILKETIGDEDESMELIRTQNDKIALLFPSHLKILCYVNLRTWWHQFENAKKIWGEPPIEMNGNWIRRWQSDDSELFFSFYKHYHIVLKSYLNIPNSIAFKSMTPPFEYIIAPGYIHLASFFLLKIESLIHRNIHTITTVIQFEQPRGNLNNSGNNSSNNNSNNISPTTNTINIDATAIGMGSLPATNIGVMLEVASKRFVETMVAIVENGYFQEMCNVWIKAVVRKTNMYDIEGLLDFIDMLIVELDARDSIVMPIELSTSSSVGSSNSSNDSSTALFSSPSLTNIIDVPFYISLIQILLNNSDHTITILRTISFVYTHFPLLTSQPNHLKHLVRDILLNEQIFEHMFCHWSRNIRIYYMRLLVWRVGRIVGKIGKNNGKSFDYTTLQTRLENLKICFEFISNYSGVRKDLVNILQAKIEKNIQEIKNYNENDQIKSYTQISSSISSSSSINSYNHVNNNGKQHRRKISLKEFKALKSATNGKEISTATTIIQWMLTNNQQKSIDSVPPSSSLSLSSTTANAKQIKQSKSLMWHYSLNRHVYASKAIFEYEAVNQDYAEWCGQISNLDDNNKGNNSNNSDYNINDYNSWIEIRFPKLTVDYPKYFGNGLVNTMF
ncbi:5667_t:CDS:10 [Entrophospora sp. SA101]|nr:5667_t:CDS:10 [Entrophospora sp. SA101]